MRPVRLAASLADTLPSPEEARSRLGRELLRPEYHEDDLLARLVEAGKRFFAQLVTATAAAPLGSVILALVIGFALVVGLILVLGRLRRAGSRTADLTGPVLGEHRLTAAEHRALAVRAFEAEEYGDCVAEAFRAAVLRPVESGRLADRPGATATELAAELGALDAAAEGTERLREVARHFDEVVYGHRTATREQATEALALDDALVGARR
ncbi:MAG: DUF4129 domain-containing protein [Nocardioides sp.]|uniref:DUF4129 domain-containing protein n=1 Tax=Nocardioides sp. TaxID=35761 RepID=UPI003F0A9C0E